METPQALQAAGQQELAVRTYEYDAESIIAVDFGGTIGEPSIDIVGDTAIVIVDEAQLEFEIPTEASDIAIGNGILTIEG